MTDGGMSPGMLTRLLRINMPELTTTEVNLIVDEYQAVTAQSSLADDATTVKEKPPAPIDLGAFGPSTLGVELQAHATLAHEHVLGALDVMSQGLHGYSQAVSKATTTILGTDDTAKQDITGVSTTLDKSTTDLSTTFAQAPPTTTPPATPPSGDTTSGGQ